MNIILIFYLFSQKSGFISRLLSNKKLIHIIQHATDYQFPLNKYVSCTIIEWIKGAHHLIAFKIKFLSA